MAAWAAGHPGARLGASRAKFVYSDLRPDCTKHYLYEAGRSGRSAGCLPADRKYPAQSGAFCGRIDAALIFCASERRTEPELVRTRKVRWSVPGNVGRNEFRSCAGECCPRTAHDARLLIAMRVQRSKQQQ